MPGAEPWATAARSRQEQSLQGELGYWTRLWLALAPGAQRGLRCPSSWGLLQKQALSRVKAAAGAQRRAGGAVTGDWCSMDAGSVLNGDWAQSGSDGAAAFSPCRKS